MTRVLSRRTTGLFAALLLSAPVLAACAESDTSSPITGTNWQITNLFLAPETPSALPDLVAGRASLVFGQSSAAGSTGCAPFQGQVTFSSDGEPTSPQDADRVSFDLMDIEVPVEGCVGQAMFIHQELSRLLDGEFDLELLSENELALTKVSDAVDPPAIRLSSDNVPETPAD